MIPIYLNATRCLDSESCAFMYVNTKDRSKEGDGKMAENNICMKIQFRSLAKINSVKVHGLWRGRM